MLFLHNCQQIILYIHESICSIESRSSCVSTTEVSENNGVSEKSSFQESNNFDSAYGHETTGKVASTTLQNKSKYLIYFTFNLYYIFSDLE